MQTQSPARPGVVITGPQGSGKTRHAEALRAHFGLAHILDDESWHAGDPVPDDTLVLTNQYAPGAIPFATAFQAATMMVRRPYSRGSVRVWIRTMKPVNGEALAEPGTAGAHPGEIDHAALGALIDKWQEIVVTKMWALNALAEAPASQRTLGLEAAAYAACIKDLKAALGLLPQPDAATPAAPPSPPQARV